VNEEASFQAKKDMVRERLNKYTRKAFKMLPKLNKPSILDIGCGSGVPTMELARLSNGEIVGLDINQCLLNVLVGKVDKARVSDRVKAIKCSIFDMEFPENSFDIIWAEGSIYAIGFERGLREWRRFLKPGGFMMIHDEQGNVKEKLEQISDCGYELLDYFALDEDIWWVEYFAPLEKLIFETRPKCTDNSKVLKELHNSQREIDMFKKNPARYCSAFLIMRKS